MAKVAALGLLLLIAGGAEAALLGRAPLTPGGADYQAFYDDVLGKTWSRPRGYLEGDPDAWAASFSLGGVDDWYLATVADLSHMRNANQIYPDVPNVFSGHPTCQGFANLQNCLPSSGLFFTSDTITLNGPTGVPYQERLNYSFQTGGTFIFGSLHAGWAITAGDPLATVVPVPAAAWLFASALGGLAWLRRSRGA